MIRLDTIKQKIPLGFIELNTSLFEATNLTDNNKLRHQLRKDISKPIGVSYIEYDDTHLIIEYSAKILKEHYEDLITIDNFELILLALEDSQIMSLPIDDFLDSTCLITHNTKNINIQDLNSRLISDPIDCVNILAMIPKPNKYLVETHTTSSNQGIEIKKRLATGSRRLIGYGKRAELERHNDPILNYVPPERFTDVFRFEANVVTFQQARKYYGIKDNTMRSILNAPYKPVNAYFQDYIQRIKDIKVDYLSGSMRYTKYNKYIAIRSVLEQHHYNIDSIKAWGLINGFTTKKELSRFIKPYEQVKLSIEQGLNKSDLKEYEALIKQFSHQLAN